MCYQTITTLIESYIYLFFRTLNVRVVTHGSHASLRSHFECFIFI